MDYKSDDCIQLEKKIATKGVKKKLGAKMPAFLSTEQEFALTD